MADSKPRLSDRVTDAARHVLEALEQDVESLATPTPVEAIAKTAAVAHGADAKALAEQPPPALPVDIPVDPLTDSDRADKPST